ncbi:MAG: hypothetical protein E3J87_08395 [Candidatus Cloacimonadota bacterium]|nr:MAG: hypothetical protein E3J87_08395 [Candidatus Cloacimonadota bacterium]
MMNRTILSYLFLLSFLIFFISATCIRKTQESKFQNFPEPFIPDGIGVNTHFPGAPEKDMKLIKEAHLKLIRADLTWAQVEREKGIYNFKRYDQLIDAFEKQGGRILFILDYKNRLYGKEKSIKTDEQRDGFARFAREAAERYKGRGVIWEIWNEPNIKQFWGDEPNVDDYMALVRVTCCAIRKVDPTSTIIAPATIGIDTKFIRGCAELGLIELVDGISVHLYREGGPESVLKSHKILRNLIKNYTPEDKPKPRIISGEWGWGLTYLDSEIIGKKGAEIKQASYLTRRFLIEAYAGIACGIYYKWREDNHGMIRPNYSLKPSYTAFKVLNEQLTGYCNEISRLEIGDEEKDFILVFEGKSGKKLVAWRTEEIKTITIPFKGKRARGVDFLGKPVEFKVKNNILNLELSGEPIFIEM